MPRPFEDALINSTDGLFHVEWVRRCSESRTSGGHAPVCRANAVCVAEQTANVKPANLPSGPEMHYPSIPLVAVQSWLVVEIGTAADNVAASPR